MNDSRDTFSDLDMSNRQTASQTALSVSSVAQRQRRLKNDFVSRMMLHENPRPFLGPNEISEIDISVNNTDVFLASSKPTIKSAQKRERIRSPTMKAYKTSVWGNASV